MTDIATSGQSGATVFIPLNRLKASPKNARRTPHSEASINALAAAISARTMLQAPVVEPERDSQGRETGYYLVHIGEGRRQAQLIRAKRKEIKKTEPIRCLIDTEHDAFEISLDENITRTAMHPADQFQAFQRLSVERGWGAEEIGARFRVSPAHVKQRLKLASVSPGLMARYRKEEMSLEQLMAFTLTDDHARQEAVWETLDWHKDPATIRRHLTRDRVSARDRRAMLVGAEAYQAAGGVIERDLFAEDHGGFFTDPVLLDRLALKALQAFVPAIETEGWKWVAVSIDQPPGHGFGRVYQQARDFTEEEQQRLDTLVEEYDRLADAVSDDDEDGCERLEALAAELDQLEASRRAYRPEDVSRAGVFITLGNDGVVRMDKGYVRAGDEADQAPEEPEADEGNEGAKKPDGPVPLSDALIADLTAHRTMALRDRLAGHPSLALTALVHALALDTFPELPGHSCLNVRAESLALDAYAPGIAGSAAGDAVAARHAAWATKFASSERSVWEVVEGLPVEDQLALLAHCVSLTVSALVTRDQAGRGETAADRLAERVSLDMRAHWKPTSESFFGRLTKPAILDAVSEAVSPDAARRISGAKKADMAAAAEEVVAGTGWLPRPLRTAPL